jgi:trehalose-phosphatase
MNDARHITRTASRHAGNHLFDCWPQVARRIRSAGHLILFLDFDGTLTRLRPRPEDVPPLDLPIRELLGGLASCRQLDVYVISGRRLSDLRSRVRVPGVRLLGLYGWEGRGVPSMRKERELVQRAKRLVGGPLAEMSRIWLEDKNLGLAVHYRGALPAEVRSARLIVRGVLEHFKARLRLLEGKKVWELFPAALGGKGSAVRRLLGKRRRSSLAIYAGDDSPDESAFAALPRGITVQVGNPRRTLARFCLRNPGEVLAFLQRLEAEIA